MKPMSEDQEASKAGPETEQLKGRMKANSLWPAMLGCNDKERIRNSVYKIQAN